MIDSEVRRIVDTAYKDATKILKDKSDELERLAQGLLEYETLNGDEIRIIVEGGTLSRKDETDDDTPAPRAKRRALVCRQVDGHARVLTPTHQDPSLSNKHKCSCIPLTINRRGSFLSAPLLLLNLVCWTGFMATACGDCTS